MEKSAIIQLGVWQHQEKFDIVCRDSQEQLLHFVLPEIDFTQLAQRIFAHYVTSACAVRLRPVCAVLPHQVWCKTRCFPHQMSVQEAEHQCRFLLMQELALPLSELWFDYCITPLKQGVRLDVFAIQKVKAQQCVQPFLPLQIEVLDTVIHALLRAVTYVQKKPLLHTDLFLYQDEQGGLAIQEQGQQTLVLQQSEGNLLLLYQQFCQRYAQCPKRVYVYRTVSSLSLPTDWLEIHSDYPLIPLGSALWQSDAYHATNPVLKKRVER